MTPQKKAPARKAGPPKKASARKTGPGVKKAAPAKKPPKKQPAPKKAPSRKAVPAKKASAPKKKASAQGAQKKKVAKKSPAPKKAAPARRSAPAKGPAGKGSPTAAAPSSKPSAPARAPSKKGPALRSVQGTRSGSETARTGPHPATRTATARAETEKEASLTKAAQRQRPPAPVRPIRGPYADDEKFLEEQRQLLLSERAVYQHQAEDLRAEAESLALEREPGDVQFDEESGEGGTVAVDRERDLTLSAQALATIEEIDKAMATIGDKTYGACENCGQPIPKARLRALPYARLCVACKSGGLHRR
jgi:DnaK suppressor protein